MHDIHPVGDQIKVKLTNTDAHGFSGGESKSVENGIAVEMPEHLAWFGFHSFAFENSFGNGSNALQDMWELYNGFIGKRVYWESLQDSGRRIKVGEDEFVLLKMTDIIAYSEPDVKAKTVTDVRRSGSFNA